MRMKGWWVAVVGACVACAKEEAAPAVAPAPSVTAAPISTAAAPSAASPPNATERPVSGHFVGGVGGQVATRIDPSCDEVIFAVAEGTAKAAGEDLQKNDALLLLAPDATVDIFSTGTALIAAVKHACPAGPRPAFAKHVVRASAAPELIWAGGAMHAHLDAEKDVSPGAYFGRLEGTAPVVEHMHKGSWEVLFAIEASGTFTLDGNPQRVGRYSVVYVPPDAKHSWAPDPGSKLVAFQIYTPPGPEQRFKGLAAEAGAPKP